MLLAVREVLARKMHNRDAQKSVTLTTTMRIHLCLPTTSGVGTSSTFPSNAPPALAQLSPHGELVLIELQGSLEVDDAPASGAVLGRLSLEAGREDRPILMVSHHRLEGRFVSLQKPLAVLEKKRLDEDPLQSMRPPTTLDADSDADEDAPPSPTLAKRPRQEAGEQIAKRSKLDSSPPRPKNRDQQDFSSSPTRSELEWSIPQEQEDKETATYYDVVSIIRRKILFSKRPEPIVRLDPQK